MLRKISGGELQMEQNIRKYFVWGKFYDHFNHVAKKNYTVIRENKWKLNFILLTYIKLC